MYLRTKNVSQTFSFCVPVQLGTASVMNFSLTLKEQQIHIWLPTFVLLLSYSWPSVSGISPHRWNHWMTTTWNLTHGMLVCVCTQMNILNSRNQISHKYESKELWNPKCHFNYYRVNFTTSFVCTKSHFKKIRHFS